MPKQFPIVSPSPQSLKLDTLDLAANEVSKDFKKQPNIEQSAALFKGPDGKYTYSQAVTNDEHDNFGMRVQIPQGSTLAGIIHSHPGNDELAHYFSPNDISVANQLKVPSYIRFAKDDSIRRYTPGQTSTTYIRGLGDHVSTGDKVNLPDPNVTVRSNDVTDPTQPTTTASTSQ
jgi:hypothetical protein